MDLKSVETENNRIQTLSKKFVIASFKGKSDMEKIRSVLTALLLTHSWARNQVREYFVELIRVRSQKELDDVFSEYGLK